MEPAQLEVKPLTNAELRAISGQYAGNPQMSSVIEKAIKRPSGRSVKARHRTVQETPLSLMEQP